MWPIVSLALIGAPAWGIYRLISRGDSCWICWVGGIVMLVPIGIGVAMLIDFVLTVSRWATARWNQRNEVDTL